MANLMRILIGGVVVLLGAAPVCWAGHTQFPVPADVVATQGPTEVRVGSRTLAVESFITALEGPRLREFYERQLRGAGWRVQRLPWQASHVASVQAMERELQLAPRQPGAELRRAELAQARATQEELLETQLYATRGSESLFVNMLPTETGNTLVFLNHWEGGREWLARPTTQLVRGTAQARHRPVSRAGSGPGVRSGWLATIPQYPGARSADEGGAHWVTADQVEEVASYYLERMRAYGWRLVEDRADESGRVRAQTYRKPGRLCTLTISPEQDADGAPGARIGIRLAASPGRAAR